VKASCHGSAKVQSISPTSVTYEAKQSIGAERSEERCFYASWSHSIQPWTFYVWDFCLYLIKTLSLPVAPVASSPVPFFSSEKSWGFPVYSWCFSHMSGSFFFYILIFESQFVYAPCLLHRLIGLEYCRSGDWRLCSVLAFWAGCLGFYCFTVPPLV
jgi:hypothetical protein